MNSKTTCKKTITFTKKDLIKKLGLSGKIEDISLYRTAGFFEYTGHVEGIEVTLLLSEEKN